MVNALNCSNGMDLNVPIQIDQHDRLDKFVTNDGIPIIKLACCVFFYGDVNEEK